MFIFNKIVHTLFPEICLLCNHATCTEAGLCHACKTSILETATHPSCWTCGEYLNHLPLTQLICGHCLMQPPPFDRVYTLSPYQQPMINLILGLKFKAQLNIAKVLGQLLAHQIQHIWYPTQLFPHSIIPIPLHPARLRTRGFNQALEIAQPIRQILNIPIDYKGVKRIKATAMQSQLSAHQRLLNMQAAFKTIQPYHKMHVAIIDDVITTGQTVKACAHALKQAGAARIDIWCCAKQMAQSSA